MLGSSLNASHGVEPEQAEPGVADADQPGRHIVDIGMLEWDLDAQIGVHRRFAVEIQLPIRTTIIQASFEDRQGDSLPDFQSIHHRDETIAGFGDVLLGGRIGLVLPEDVPRWTLALRPGISLPSGNIEPDPFELGEGGDEHQHMFFGSGTVDPLLGLDTNLAFDRWTLVGWVVGKAPLYANQYDYRGSRVAVGGLGARSGLGLKRWSFLPSLDRASACRFTCWPRSPTTPIPRAGSCAGPSSRCSASPIPSTWLTPYCSTARIMSLVSRGISMRSIVPTLSVLSLALCACRPASEPEEAAVAEVTPAQQLEGDFVFSIDGMKKVNGAL